MRKSSIYTQIKQLPAKPGVYLFRDTKGGLLYVGKANNLKNRVASYFRHPANKSSNHPATQPSPSPDLTPAKQQMVRRIASVDTTIVSNESEALLLESSLIKRTHPPYNIVLADDKSFVYIKFDFDRIYPDVHPVRRPHITKRARSLYFGPYASAAAAHTVLRLAKKIFPYCLKPPRERHPRLPRPCLNWHLRRCPGPCVGKISPAQYEKKLRRMIPLFKGSYREVMRQLTTEMRAAAATHAFERAALIRDQLRALKKIAEKQKIISTKKESYDALSLASGDTLSLINIFRVRSGVLIDRASSPLQHPATSAPHELLESFLRQYYAYTADMPRIIYVPLTVSSPLPDTCRIIVPQRGNKYQLMRLGEENALEELGRITAQRAQDDTHAARALTLLKTTLRLTRVPARIEAYDISNIQGSHAVGAMTVLINGIPSPAQYRKFTIRTVRGSNDVAMLKEMLRRRLAHSVQRNKKTRELESKLIEQKTIQRYNNITTRTWPLPDLIVIDGGRPQLSAACAVLGDYKLRIPLLALAKGRGLSPAARHARGEEIWCMRTPTDTPRRMHSLPKHSSALLLLDRIRDEAHRFGISHYRRTHRKETLAVTRLNNIPGIGPKTRTLLLQTFGSLERIRHAPHQELAAHIGAARAKLLLRHLNRHLND